MKTHDFVITGCDTDSIAFKKKDESPFTEREQKELIEEINRYMKEGIIYTHDGYYDVFMVLKAKNYCLLEEGKDKIKKKGSSITDSKKEPALQSMLNECIEELMRGKRDIIPIAKNYLRQASMVVDIDPWCVKKTVTKNLRTSERKNETKVMDAIGDKIVSDGDKLFLFNDIDGVVHEEKKGEKCFRKYKKKEWLELGLEKNDMLPECDHTERTFCMKCNNHLHYPKMIPNRILRLREDFTGSYDIEHYKDRIIKTIEILKNVIDYDSIKVVLKEYKDKG